MARCRLQLLIAVVRLLYYAFHSEKSYIDYPQFIIPFFDRHYFLAS